ncbi:MAG: hypothetical protein JNL74_14400 [Fibrobacteres bacterium]|nr:hypothetical protein [Fibrobacterota bacterium]
MSENVKNQHKNQTASEDSLGSSSDALRDLLEISIQRKNEMSSLVKLLDQRLGEADNTVKRIEEAKSSIDALKDSLNKSSTEARKIATEEIAPAKIRETIKELSADLGTVEERIAQIHSKASELDGMERKLTELVKSVEPGTDKFRDDLKIIVSLDRKVSATASALEDSIRRQRDLKREAEQTKEAFNEARTLAPEIADTIAQFKREREAYLTVKQKVDALHMLSEHVNTKVRNLERQRTVVERANQLSGKLNVMLWDMENAVRELNSQVSKTRKTEDKIEKLDNMLQSATAGLEDVRQYERILLESESRIKTMEEISRETEKRLAEFEKRKQQVEDALTKAHEVHTLTHNADAIMNTLTKQFNWLQSNNSKIAEHEKSMSRLRAKVDELETQWSVIDEFDTRLGKIRNQTAEVEAHLRHVSDTESKLTAQLPKLDKYNENAVALADRMDKIESRREEIKALENDLEQFKQKIAGTDKAMEDLSVREAAFREFAARFKKLEANAQIAADNAEALSAKTAFVGEVENRIKNLSSLVGEIDDKINLQLQRKSLVDKVEKRIDQLNVLYEETTLRVQTLGQHDATVKEIENRLNQLNATAKVLDDRVVQVSQESSKIANEEARIIKTVDTIKGLREAAEGLVQRSQSDHEAAAARAEESRRVIQTLLAETSEKMKTVEAQKQNVASAVKEVSKGTELYKNLEQSIEGLKRKQAIVDGIDSKIEKTKSTIADFETRLNAVVAAKSEVEVVHKETQSLQKMLDQTKHEIELVSRKERYIVSVEERLNSLTERIHQVDDRMAALAEKEKAVREAESRLEAFALLLEDVRTEMANLKREESLIRQANQSAAELAYLVSEAEARIGDLKRASHK